MHGGCRPGMPKRQDDRPGSGCRADCLHRALIAEYREAKAASDEARKLKREAATGGYGTEGAEWDAANPAWTFRDFLRSRAQLDDRPAQVAPPSDTL